MSVQDSTAVVFRCTIRQAVHELKSWCLVYSQWNRYMKVIYPRLTTCTKHSKNYQYKFRGMCVNIVVQRKKKLLILSIIYFCDLYFLLDLIQSQRWAVYSECTDRGSRPECGARLSLVDTTSTLLSLVETTNNVLSLVERQEARPRSPAAENYQQQRRKMASSDFLENAISSKIDEKSLHDLTNSLDQQTNSLSSAPSAASPLVTDGKPSEHPVWVIWINLKI